MHRNIKLLTKKWVCNYNPSTGRFLSEDPIGFNSGDVNLYRYVGNSPVVFGDPSGLIVNDMTNGLISGSVKSGELYKSIDKNPNITVDIYADTFLPFAGLTSWYGKKYQKVAINPIYQKNDKSYLHNTIIHELNHVRLNYMFDFSTSEEFDTEVVLPKVLQNNPINRCELR
jgi:uncharacterized protein RhaS with RHS repeats